MNHRPEPAPLLRTTPLHSVHAAQGAVFTDFGGWEMPLRYTSDLAEHHAVRRSAGLFDLSHMGEVKVTGPGAVAALDHALVGRISAVAIGRARYTMIVAADGGIIDDLIVYHVGEEEYLVVPNAGNRERVAAALAERCAGFECAVADLSLSMALIAVQGPRAEEILRGVVESGAGIPAALRPVQDPAETEDCGEPDVLCGPGILARLRYYAAVRATAAGHAVLLARTGYTGEDGFELFCGAEDAVDLWTVITSHAAGLAPGPGAGPGAGTEPLPALTPCGLAARDSLRLEAGMPLYGQELTEAITPFDASLGAVVALDKPDFVGRAALERRARGEGEPGTLRLVALAGRGRRAARAGCPVRDADGRQVGTVTSGLLSPTLGHPVALALLGPSQGEAAPDWTEGTELVVDVRGRDYPMTVVAAPFYKRPR
ncbi:MAG: glycine cleavage system aminomethyltransferase GcvT [Actinomyces sp.]|uniref:glycine cleavage system aminomethyltransferase GcvT n=1 Tax=Actinomyces sp. TaxID=29317 RepID=UPI0026DD61EF|nr:glycine cleavage system aminomethyltransferase GcvT [Actinomyces sp.]MDO4242703.1 glycine cleavage system aminomethyltransferase GcvT [Actinomyces sp.]